MKKIDISKLSLKKVLSGITICTVASAFILIGINVSKKNVLNTEKTTIIPNEIFQAKAANNIAKSDWVNTSCRVVRYNNKSYPLGPASWKVTTTISSTGRKVVETYSVNNWGKYSDMTDSQLSELGISFETENNSCENISNPTNASPVSVTSDYSFSFSAASKDNVGINSGGIFSWRGCVKGEVKLSYNPESGITNTEKFTNSSLGDSACTGSGGFGANYGAIGGWPGNNPNAIGTFYGKPGVLCKEIKLENNWGNPVTIGLNNPYNLTDWNYEAPANNNKTIFIKTPTSGGETPVGFLITCNPEKPTYFGSSKPITWTTTVTDSIF